MVEKVIGIPVGRDVNFSGNVKTVGNIPEISEKRSETFRNVPIYRPSARFLKFQKRIINLTQNEVMFAGNHTGL